MIFSLPRLSLSLSSLQKPLASTPFPEKCEPGSSECVKPVTTFPASSFRTSHTCPMHFLSTLRDWLMFVNNQPPEADPGVSWCLCMLRLDCPCILIGLDAIGFGLKSKAGMFHMEMRMLSSGDYRIVNGDNWLLRRSSPRSDLKTESLVRQAVMRLQWHRIMKRYK